MTCDRFEVVTYRCNFSTWRALWSRCGPNLSGSEPPPCILRRRREQEIVKNQTPLFFLPPDLISRRVFFFFFFLQDSPDRKLHIMFSRRTYRINSNSPKKDKAGGQNNPLLLNSHTHIDTHSIFRWFSRHTIEGEICFLSPRRLSIDDLRRKPTPCPYLCSSSLLSMM